MARRCVSRLAYGSTHTARGGKSGAMLQRAMLVLVLVQLTEATVTPGCYTDSTAQRLLPYAPFKNDDPSINAETCNAACAAKNYTVGGLEAGHGCFCGNELAPPIGPLQPITDCCDSCIGNASQVCGGDLKLLVFKVGKPPVHPPAECPQFQPVKDPRHIRKGIHMLTQGYLDQPYCVVMRPKKHDAERPGRWVCTITGSIGGEGSEGEHVQSLYSDDSGATWSDPISVEPSPIDTELANAYSVVLTAPGMAAHGGERVYTLYNMNLHNVTALPPKNVSGNTTVAGIEAPVAYDIEHAAERFRGSYVRCNKEATTMPCAAAYDGDTWNEAPVYALRSETKSVDRENRTIFYVLIRDTGIWRLAEVANRSDGSTHGRKLEWPGRAVYECTKHHAGGVAALPPATGWTRVEDGSAVEVHVTPGNVTIPGLELSRTDCQGYFVMRYSDDGAESWSTERIRVPYRMSEVDRVNDFKGKVREMWTVDQVKVHEGTAYFAFTEIAHYLLAPPEEMWVMASHNILKERNASLVKWNLLPDGEYGVPPPFRQLRNTSQEDTVVEEAHILPLDGQEAGFYMLGRTTLGYLAASWTANKAAAEGWHPTQYAQYWDPSRSENVQQLRPLSHSRFGFGGVTPDGAGLKNPRGPITARQITAGPLAGLYLLLYYNNACESYESTARNPYWLTGGDPELEHAQHQLLWAQPEIVLYDTQRDTHPGYPDIIQDPTDVSRIVITETQKQVARLHEIPQRILKALETQHSVRTLAPTDKAKRILVKKHENVRMLKTPEFVNFNATTVQRMGNGFTVGFVLRRHSKAQPGDILIDSRDSPTLQASEQPPAGVAVVVSDQHGLVLSLSDGKTLVQLETDLACTAALDFAPDPEQLHYVGFVVDAGPRILRVAVDGVLCDGGGPSTTPRPLGTPSGHGYAFFDPIGDIRGSNKMDVAPTYGGELIELQLYERALLTSELVGNYRYCCMKDTKAIMRDW